MSRQAIALRVPIDPSWEEDTRIQVYTDFGSGTIDTSKPLLVRPAVILKGQAVDTSVGEAAPFEQQADLGAPRPAAGRADALDLGNMSAEGQADYAVVTVLIRAAFGVWKFAAQAQDKFGNVQAGGLVEFSVTVSGDDPPGVYDVTLNSYTPGTGKVQLGFLAATE